MIMDSEEWAKTGEQPLKGEAITRWEKVPSDGRLMMADYLATVTPALSLTINTSCNNGHLSPLQSTRHKL